MNCTNCSSTETEFEELASPSPGAKRMPHRSTLGQWNMALFPQHESCKSKSSSSWLQYSRESKIAHSSLASALSAAETNKENEANILGSLSNRVPHGRDTGESNRVAAPKTQEKSASAALTAAASSIWSPPLLSIKPKKKARRLASRGPWNSPDGKPRAMPMLPVLPEQTLDENSSMSTRASSFNQVVPSPVAVVHARLDPSLECTICHVGHELYLMYPVVKTLDTWNDETKYLCSQCQLEGHQVEETQDNEAEENVGGCRLALPSLLKREDDQRRVHTRNNIKTASSCPRPKVTCLVRENDCNISACLDMLNAVEDELEVAVSLSEDCSEPLAASVRRELQARNNTTANSSYDALNRLEQNVKEELRLHTDLWQQHWDLLQDTATVLQAAIEAEGDEECDLLLAYYQWRAGHRLQPGVDATDPAWKIEADTALDKRDAEAGIGPGQFHGASGWSSRRKESQCVTEDDQDEDEDPYRDFYIEEVATFPESQYYQIFPTQRGLGWNSTQEVDNDVHDEALSAAYKTEAGIECLVRTESEDRDKSQHEFKAEVRTLLVLVEARDTQPSSEPMQEKLHSINTTSHVRPELTATKRSTLEQLPQETHNTKNDQDCGDSSDYSTFSEYKENAALKECAIKPPTFPSPPKARRAKRRCLRCVKFAGTSPTKCRGAKGRWGQKGCEYFSATGKKLKELAANSQGKLT